MNIRGPVKDKAGVLALMEQARLLIEQGVDDDGNIQKT